MSCSYEIRTADLMGIFIGFPFERAAIQYWHEHIEGLPPTDIRHGAVVVEHTWESGFEAESARLNFMISPNSQQAFSKACLAIKDLPPPTDLEAWSRVAREVIDVARSAPESTVRVIWPKPAAA